MTAIKSSRREESTVDDQREALTRAAMDLTYRGKQLTYLHARAVVDVVLREQHRRFLAGTGQGPEPDPDGGVELSDQELADFLLAARGVQDEE